MSHCHKIYRIGKRYIVVNAHKFRPSKPRHELIIKKLGLKLLFTFNTVGGMYQMGGIVNARKYFADNKFAKLNRVADGVELQVQKAKKEIRREKKNGVRDKEPKDGTRRS